MHLIKLNATESTNDYLKEMALHTVLTDFTVVTANNQTKGKGQMGSSWQVESGKNLTFSVLKSDLRLASDTLFLLNVIVSLAVHSTLKSIGVPDLRIKWPNDILSGSFKICGILVESQLSGPQLKLAILGIGLNVNQTKFGSLVNASSLKLLLGKTLELEELLFSVVKQLKKYFQKFENDGPQEIWNEYTQLLFRLNKPSTFKNVEDQMFMGFIRGVSPQGKLQIELEDHILKEFGLKEVKLLY
ncbi:biotin--[acetyl-CoA-carboxylase] ligase [Cytophaga sp. FL35]|uniref:biotin--[acetyl-CoA-carboxylase] ligase n=1 Tax=Cytophaga sp. FL35 TaxID=1904456 RepID=UPI0016534C47|nr:biotin--[acetyl-CoA-carboxylase] ligase [Cytophaga sp. FL35]MBC6999541.1 biotin--[acetyl-CoA-carboxylase] ligase [Cytophaga sp. FL35]